MSKTLRLNVNHIILFKTPKNQLSQIYINFLSFSLYLIFNLLFKYF